MTKVMAEGFGWMYIVVVLDWYTKKIVGYYAGMQCRKQALAGSAGHGSEQAIPWWSTGATIVSHVR